MGGYHQGEESMPEYVSMLGEYLCINDIQLMFNHLI